MNLNHKKCKSAKKGITLSEMCVVIGIIAIVSVAVVSFTTIASAITKVSAAKEKAAEKINLVENLVEGWVENAVLENATELQVKDNKLVAKINDKDYIVSFSNNTLKASFSSGNESIISFEEITKIDFQEMRNDSDVIFFCTVTYAIKNSQEIEIEKTHTFCVNTRLGDTV